MEKPLQYLKLKFAFILVTCLIISSNVRADKDSCWAAMNINTDQNDPMTIHFDFAGTVPPGSFSFLGSWDFGDGDMSNDSCPVHTYAQPGTYTVCLAFNICIGGGMSCHDDTCVTITVGNLAGIQNPDGNLHHFYFYPNPVRSSFHIRSDATRILEIKIQDETGREIVHGIAGNDEAIVVSNLPAGIYVLVASDGKSILQRKMVVQK